MSWTEERVDLLKKLWGEGKTAAEIAKALGDVTRNAVIGKAHRLKLSTRVSPIQQNTKKTKVEAPKIVKPKKPQEEIKIKGKGFKMDELEGRMCRWPIGDPQDDDFVFCGHNIAEGSPYCEGHSKMAYQVSSRSRKLQAEDFSDDAGAPQDFDIKHAVGS